MRFTTLSLILTLSAILTATTCHSQGTTPPSEAPTADSTELDHPRLVYSKESKSLVMPPSSSGPAQMMDAAGDDQATPTQLRRRRHLYDLSHPQKRQHNFAPKEQPVQHILRNIKREALRQLAGEKRSGSLLDDLVGDKKENLAGGQEPPAGTTPAQEPTPSEDGKVQSKSGSNNLMERQEAEDESVQDEESEATEEEDSDDTEQKSTESDLDPLGQSLEDVTKSSDESDSSSSAPSEDATDSATTPTSDEDSETPTSTPEESSASSEPSSETPELVDTSAPPPTDPVVSISSDVGTDNNGVDPNDPQKAPTTTSEPPPAADVAQPTTTHSANADATSEANKESAKTSIMIGVVAAALLLAAALCVWIFRRLKLSPSRQFRGKTGGGGAAGGVHARNNYGPGHEDGSDYNSYDGFYRGPESPLPMMAHAAGPSVIGGMAMASSSTGATDGFGPYPAQNLAHMSMSSESMTDYQQYSYGDGYDGTNAPTGSAQGQGLAALPMVPPSTVGGLPVVGHNVHKYGSEDYSQNTYFLRELRE